jgi:hypothetical protein
MVGGLPGFRFALAGRSANAKRKPGSPKNPTVHKRDFATFSTTIRRALEESKEKDLHFVILLLQNQGS